MCRDVSTFRPLQPNFKPKTILKVRKVRNFINIYLESSPVGRSSIGGNYKR